jgi:hypothetical protein
VLNNQETRQRGKKTATGFPGFWVVNYFERNQMDFCLFKVGAPKFLFAAAGIFRLHWRKIFPVHERDD